MLSKPLARALVRGEMRMDLGYDGSAFTYRSADTFDGAGAHIADRKDARDAGLQRQQEIPTRFHETFVVESDAAVLQPVGARLRSQKKENVPYWPLDRVIGTAPSHRLDACLPRAGDVSAVSVSGFTS